MILECIDFKQMQEATVDTAIDWERDEFNRDVDAGLLGHFEPWLEAIDWEPFKKAADMARDAET